MRKEVRGHLFGLESYFFEYFILLFVGFVVFLGCGLFLVFFFFYAKLYGSVIGINPVVLDGGIVLKNLVKIVSML